MTHKSKRKHPSRVNHKTPPGIEALYDTELQESFRRQSEEIRKRAGYESTAAEVRAMVGKELGGRTLKEVLRELDNRESSNLSSE